MSLVGKFIRFRFVAGKGERIFVSSAPPAVDSLPHTHGIGGIPREALEFIIDEEGMDQPGKFPGGDSGVTLGHGYDLGAATESKTEMVEDSKQWLTGAASALCQQFRDIKITVEAVDAVFFRATIPIYLQKIISAFPTVEKLPGPAQCALLSLIFRRGTSLKGERRMEIRKIRVILTGEPWCDLKAIGRDLRAMGRTLKRERFQRPHRPSRTRSELGGKRGSLAFSCKRNQFLSFNPWHCSARNCVGVTQVTPRKARVKALWS